MPAKKKPATSQPRKAPKVCPRAIQEAPTGYTLARFSTLAGFDRHTLATRAAEMKVAPVGRSVAQKADVFALRDLVRLALGGDIEAEKLRKTREEADKLALQNARARGELVEIAAVKRLGENVMAGLRTRILSFPLTDDEKDKLLVDLRSLGEMDWTRSK